MKKKITAIIITVVVTVIISIGGAYAATSYAISASKIGYTDNSSLGATNVQAAIDGTCSKVNSRLTSIEKHSVRAVTSQLSGTCATVTHNLNLSNYYPLVSLGSQQSHAYVIYNISSVTANSFKVCVGTIDNFTLTTPTDGWSINLVWTY